MQPKDTQIQQEIVAAIAEHFGMIPQDIDREKALIGDMNVDRLQFGELFGILSERFNVHLTSEEIRNYSKDIEEVTVNDLIAIIEDLSLE
jgi:acyl carrier protein